MAKTDSEQKGVPPPAKVEAFLSKMTEWGRKLPEAEQALLSHLLRSSSGIALRPKVKAGEGFWAEWSQRQY